MAPYCLFGSIEANKKKRSAPPSRGTRRDLACKPHMATRIKEVSQHGQKFSLEIQGTSDVCAVYWDCHYCNCKCDTFAALLERALGKDNVLLFVVAGYDRSNESEC